MYNLDTILSAFPRPFNDVMGELKGQCPYCPPEAGTVYRGNLHFTGDDRFIIFTDGRVRALCRKCGTFVYLDQLAKHLFGPEAVIDEQHVSEYLVRSAASRPVKKKLHEMTVMDISAEHAAVDRSFWRAFGWSDFVIDELQLGYGPVWRYGVYGPTKEDRHLFPVRIATGEQEYDGWIFEGRNPKSKIKTVKVSATDSGYFGFRRDENDKTLIITEGTKDAGSAYQIGFRNFMVMFGASKWDRSMCAWITRNGFTKVIVAGDNDDEGEKLNRRVAADLAIHGVQVVSIKWPENAKKGYDVSDLLLDKGKDAYRYINESSMRPAHRGFVKDIRSVNPDYKAPVPDFSITRDTVRQELPSVINAYLDTYKRSAPSLKILAAQPGSGKTYALVQVMQERARKFLAKKKIDLRRLDAQIEEEGDDDARAKLLEKRDKYNTAKIVFASPFINAWDDLVGQPNFDPTLWFNFEARSEENCESFETANAIGAAGYSVTHYCENHCPFFQKCKETGYMRQETDRRKFPITFFRHANLTSATTLDGYKLLVIDEDPAAVFVNDIKVDGDKHLRPVDMTWAEYSLSDQKIKEVNNFLKALRLMMAEHVTREGREFMAAFERMLGYSVAELSERVGSVAISVFQPLNVPQNADYSNLPHRIVPVIYAAILDEVYDYLTSKTDYNSRLRQVGGKLYVVALFKQQIKPSMPIIVADGTAYPELYAALFNRRVEMYSPDLYNPYARIIQITGRDYTMSALSGVPMPVKSESVDIVQDVFGNTIVLDDFLEATDRPYDNISLKNAILSLRKIASGDYQKILVVARTRYIDVLLKAIKPLAKKDAGYRRLLVKAEFAHYQSLRGSNAYKDFDCIVLIGCPRVPYSAIRYEAQAWCRIMGITEYVQNVFTSVVTPYHGEGLYAAFAHTTFTHPIAQLLVNRSEVGEVQQCLDRIRLYASEDRKTAYCLMNRPTVRYITDILPERMFVEDPQDSQYLLVQGYYAEHKREPTIDWLCKQSGCTRYAARSVLSRFHNSIASQ